MPDRPRLEAVLFDAGGTLGRLDFEWMAECVTTLGFALDAVTLRAAEVDGRRALDRSVGLVDVADGPALVGAPEGAIDPHPYFFGMLVAASVPEPLIPVVLEHWLLRQAGAGLWGRTNEGAPEALEGVRQLGLRRAVVSNSDGRAEQHLREWGVRAELEFVIDSQIVGFAKPDARIFGLALDRMGLEPQRVLYAGDIRCGDEVGSNAAGLHFVLIDPDGSYARPGTPRIACIADLPAWIREHFDVPGPGGLAPKTSTLHPSTPEPGGSR